MNAKDYERYERNVKDNLKGLSFVSTGSCPGCGECGLDEEATEEQRSAAEEGHFSWSDCDCCGQSLGGARYPAHGRDKDGRIIHLDVCEDCLYYINYARLDDTQMMEIEDSKKTCNYHKDNPGWDACSEDHEGPCGVAERKRKETNG